MSIDLDRALEEFRRMCSSVGGEERIYDDREFGELGLNCVNIPENEYHVIIYCDKKGKCKLGIFAPEKFELDIPPEFLMRLRATGASTDLSERRAKLRELSVFEDSIPPAVRVHIDNERMEVDIKV